MFGLIISLLFSYPIIVKDVKVEGLKWKRPDFVIYMFGIQPGDTLLLPDVTDAMKKLYHTQYFEDIELVQYGPDSAATLVVRVKENPRLRSITFIGKKIKPDELKDSVLQLTSFTEAKEKGRHKGKKYKALTPMPLPESRIFEWSRKIEKYYQSKGYAKCKVESELSEPDSLGLVDLVLKVERGKKVHVKKIEFFGVTAFEPKKLKKVMKTKERGFLRSGTLKLDQWADDPKRIEEFYANNGYPNARVDSTKIEYSDGDAFIKIWITEGRKLVIGNISVEAAPPFTSDYLLELIKIKSGEPFSREKYIDAVMKIADAYRDSGYLYVQVTPLDSLYSDSIVDVRFVVEPGSRVAVRKIIIKGNTKTRDYVILRELDIFPGDYFSSSKLRKSQRDLFMLNFFSNVTVDFEEVGDSLIDLIFTVTEKPTGQAMAGVSYSGFEGLAGNISYLEPNFRGKGQIFSAMLQHGQRGSFFQLGFTEPWLGGKPRSLGFDLHHVYYRLFEYDEQRTGGGVTFSTRVWNDYWRLTLSYDLNRIYLYNINPVFEERYKEFTEGPVWRSSVSFSLTRDTRNHPFFPNRGSRWSYNLVLAGGPLGGDIRMHKHTMEWSYYFPKPFTGEKWASVIWLRGGYVGGFNPKDWAEGVPFNERFFLGDIGFYGLRGYDFRSVGPVQDGVVVGGRVFSIFTLEERYKASDNIYVLAFAEAGNAWNNIAEAWDTGVRRSIGVGFRIEIPMMGIWGFDIGYGFDKTPPGWTMHVQVGTMF